MKLLLSSNPLHLCMVCETTTASNCLAIDGVDTPCVPGAAHSSQSHGHLTVSEVGAEIYSIESFAAEPCFLPQGPLVATEIN
jgi:hypothetical protein